jgi:cysteine synthase A
MIFDSILDTIGRTPVVRIHRLAIGIVLDAEQRGELKPGQTVVEATSGNTGIALAMVCAARGYPFVAFMAESFSIERRKLMRDLGARVIHTPAAERATGMIKRAEEFAARHGAFLARQFDNPANPAYHRSTTGPEILQDFAGRRLDWFVSGWGTGGTLTGAGQMLKLARPDLRIATTEPAGAAMLAGKEWAPHKIQGWTPNLIPSVLDRGVYELNLPVTDEVARDTARDLAMKEGIFCGISSGGTFAAALQVAREHAKEGDVILAMRPDTGERYLSTFLFEGMNEGSDDEWLASLP